MANPGIRTANPADEAGVVHVVTLAFETDPMARWSFPDASVYSAVMPAFVRAFGGHGFARGSVHFVDDGTGAAMWLGPGVEPDVEMLQHLLEQNAPADRQDEMMAVFEQMGGYHPHEPHWYLPLIGVDPTQQGRGLGTALLRHAVGQFDAEGLPAYLESSNPRNISLYRRLGFEPLGEIQVGTSPILVPMLRRPQKPAGE